MALNVLVVEDLDDDWNSISEAVNAHNAKAMSERFVVRRARVPEEVTACLSLETDVIISDVFFKPAKQERLSEVIGVVRTWEADIAGGLTRDRRLPLIAFTGRGERALAICLRQKEQLFDIWDKSIADGPYVVWRLTELSAELTRLRPDALLQRLIREMSVGPSWHGLVVEMAAAYDAGLTEADQVRRAGHIVRMIADRSDAFRAADAMWEVVEQWEMLGRAVDVHMRGHARHVINVFWLGYYLINHPELAQLWEAAWNTMKTDRSRMGSVAAVPWQDAINNVWFLAALFHDTGYCVEKQPVLKSRLVALQRAFGVYVTVADADLQGITATVETVLEEFDGGVRGALTRGFEESLAEGRPDHGAISAAKLLSELRDEAFSPYAREAARAVILHNLLPKADVGVTVSWHDEPLGCLLLVCDQLQAWDRERFDGNYLDLLQPEAAELESLTVKRRSDGRVGVEMTIDYVVPRYVNLMRDLRAPVQDRLENVLSKFPKEAISRVTGDWPFDLEITFSMSGQRLRPVIQRGVADLA